jgi:hypothetical protein
LLLRITVAVLLGIEAGVFLYSGATWIVPHVVLAVIALGW